MRSDAVGMPKRPTSATELAALVRELAQGGGRVRMVGSGSMPLAASGEVTGMQDVSTLRMNKVLEHAVGDMTVVVEAGISLEALQRKLAWHNQWLPVDPPAIVQRPGMSPGQRTIGGLIASNALGPLRMGCGDWRLLVMGMRWVEATGTLIRGGGRTVKNVAGYSTPRMMIGACGSLGAIAEVTLRTFARPADEQCAIFFCDSAKRAEMLLAAILESPTTPAYVQVVGGQTFSGNPLQLPTVKQGMAVMAGFLDRPANCAAQVAILRELPEATSGGVEVISQTAAQAGRLRLWMTSEPGIDTRQPEGVGFRIAVLSSEVCLVVAEIEKIAAAGKGGAWVVSEAGAGVVRSVVSGDGARSAIDIMLQRVAPGARLTITQGPQRSASEGIASCLKKALDPASRFGDLPGPS